MAVSNSSLEAVPAGKRPGTGQERLEVIGPWSLEWQSKRSGNPAVTAGRAQEQARARPEGKMEEGEHSSEPLAGLQGGRKWDSPREGRAWLPSFYHH